MEGPTLAFDETVAFCWLERSGLCVCVAYVVQVAYGRVGGQAVECVRVVSEAVFP